MATNDNRGSRKNNEQKTAQEARQKIAGITNFRIMTGKLMSV
jgi:hypothetical protein